MYIFSAPPFLFQAPEVLCTHERADGKKSVENGAQPPDSRTADKQKKGSCRRAVAPLLQTPEVLCSQDPSGRKRRAENAAQPSERRSALEQKNDSDRRASARRGVPALAVLRDLPLKSQNCQRGRLGWARHDAHAHDAHAHDAHAHDADAHWPRGLASWSGLVAWPCGSSPRRDVAQRLRRSPDVAQT